MVVKFALHHQWIPNWSRAVHEDAGSAWVKVMDPAPDKDPFPKQNKIIRFYTDEWDRDLVNKGRAGADAYMARMVPIWKQFSHWQGTKVFELPNEVLGPGNQYDGLAILDEFTLRCIEIANANGLTLGLWNLPEGNPHDDGTGKRDIERAKMQRLVRSAIAGIEGGHYFDFHAYWVPWVDNGPLGDAHALRHRRNLQYLKDAGVPVERMKVYIGEAGVDLGIVFQNGRGWKTAYKNNREAYIADIVTFEKELRKDPQVVCYAIFGAGYFDPWGDFEINEDTARAIVAAIKKIPAEDVWTSCEDRQGYKPSYIVWHSTDCPDAEVVKAYTANPANKASYHIIISEDGKELVCAPLDKAAWHANSKTARLPDYPEGKNVNLPTIAVALAHGGAAMPKYAYPVAQIRKAVEVGQRLMRQFNIPIERNLSHTAVDPTNRPNDPRDLDFCWFLTLLQGRPFLDWTRLCDAAQKHVIPINPNAALCRYIHAHGWHVMSDEFLFEDGGVTYVCQVGYSPDDDMQHICAVPMGNWDQITHKDFPNTRKA